MFRRLLHLLQGESFCMLKTIVIFCDYIGLQLLYNYLRPMQSQNITIVLSIIKFSLKMAQQAPKHVGEKVIINT
jgi:hypothetical protein